MLGVYVLWLELFLLVWVRKNFNSKLDLIFNFRVGMRLKGKKEKKTPISLARFPLPLELRYKLLEINKKLIN
jgi:hypothetical protein